MAAPGLLKAKITMKMYNILRQYSAIVGVLFFVIVLSATCTYCWSTLTVAAQNKVITKSKGLTLSPLRNEIEIAPGTSLDGELTVTNSTDKLMAVRLNAEEFKVVNQQYDYAFTEESDTAKWVSFTSAEIDLAIGESKNIPFRIGVPLSAEPGGRYISLFASTDTGTTGGSISSRQRVASLLYITVTGDVTRDGNLLSLTSPWAVSGESMWSMALQNTGTTHFRSQYAVQMQKILGGGAVASSSGDVLILPGTVRTVPDKLPLPQLPGIYKVVYMIGLGDKPAVSETRWMIYAPLWAIILFAVIVISLALGLLHKKLRKKHQSV